MRNKSGFDLLVKGYFAWRILATIEFIGFLTGVFIVLSHVDEFRHNKAITMAEMKADVVRSMIWGHVIVFGIAIVVGIIYLLVRRISKGQWTN